ncbi:elongator complex protein [Cyclospora cayetanensis]|uniref:ubiquitinyl hydrolase 1 n=1 Tax=Cyclospora cayetanensis TaxID=88456 RepID=A0A1D3D5R4_9EIME|nr:elongator complex protein [Cyclospora cayetanensis]
MVYRLKQSSPSWATNVDCAPPELDAGPPAVAPACARGPAVASRTAATSGSQGSGFLQRRVSQRWRLVGNRGGRHTHQHQSQQDQAAKFSESSCVLQQKEYLVTSSVCPVNASPIDGIEGVDTTKEPSREPLHSRQPATLKLHRSGGAGVDSSTAGNGPMQGESVNTALQPAAKWKAGPPWDVGTPQVVDLEGAAGSCGGDVGANSRIAPRADCVNPNSTRSISSICRRTRWKSLPLGLPCVLPGQPPLDGSRSASEPVKLGSTYSHRSCSKSIGGSKSSSKYRAFEQLHLIMWNHPLPADEQNDVATSCSHSSSTEISLRKGRRVASRLQRMASSMGCFGEAALRRIEPQRGGSPVVTSAEHKAWRKQLESFAEDGSFFPRGLTNLKNTCFLNAALQALAGIPSFVSTLQEGLPPEPGYSGAFWGPQRLINEEFDGVHEETSAVAAAGCSSTTATPPNEDATGQQQQQELQRRQILRQLRLQQQRRRQQPQNLTTLDENQRRLLLREFFTLLCRLTCCPNVRPVDRGVDPHEGLAARRPRHSNSQATCRTEASPHQQQQTAATQPGSIRPERLRRALVAPLEGLLLKDCSLQQQQDCHEFLRGLIDIVHEILKTCRWEREEAAAEQLLQLQAEVSFSALRSCSPSVSDSPLAPFEDKDNQQQEQLPPTGSSVSATAASSLSSLICPLQSSLSGPPVVQALKGLPSVGSQLETSGDKGTGELAERSNNDEGGLDLAEKKWKEYLEDQASPMSDFFAGQIKRFSAVGQKRRSKVEFPLENLSIQLSRGSASFRLIAVIEHKGSSCHTGHYVAYVRRKRFQFPQSTPSKMHSQALGAQGASPRGLWASGGSSLRPDTPRNSACSPSELLKRIGLFSRSNSSLQSPIVSQPNSPSTSTPSACGSPYHSGAQRPHGVSTQETLPPTRLHRYGGVNQGSIDDASEWFRFDDGLVLPVSELEVLAAEAYCLFYYKTDLAASPQLRI